MNLIKKLFARLHSDRPEPVQSDHPLYRPLTKLLGFSPTNICHYELALHHCSNHTAQKGAKFANNERLEFLGDAVLSSVIADVLYHEYDNKREGFLTNVRSKIVQRETLNHLAKELGFEKLIHVSNRVTSHNLNIYGNAFEALIGAIYLDKGYDHCQKFLREVVLAHYINVKNIAAKEINFKSKLIEWSQKNKAQLEFEVIAETEDAQKNKIFKSRAMINGIEAGLGNGFSKKESHQNAAKSALNLVKKNPKLFFVKAETKTQE